MAEIELSQPLINAIGDGYDRREKMVIKPPYDEHEMSVEDHNIQGADEDITGLGDEIPTANFKIWQQKYSLTYKHHLPKEEFKKWMGTIKKNFIPKQIEMAHETGDKTIKYNHTHVMVDFGKKFQSSSPKIFDYVHEGETIHPYIKAIKSNTQWEASLNYLAKEDPENAHLKKSTVQVTLNAIASCETAKEFMEKNATFQPKTKTLNFTQLKAGLDIYEMLKDVPAPQYRDPTIPWQIEFMKKL